MAKVMDRTQATSL